MKLAGGWEPLRQTSRAGQKLECGVRDRRRGGSVGAGNGMTFARRGTKTATGAAEGLDLAGPGSAKD